MPDPAATVADPATTTTTTVPASAANGSTPAAGAGSFDWGTLTLDPEVKSLVTDRQWKTPNDAIKSYQNLEKLTGVPPEQMLKLPKGDDPAAWNEVWNRLGRPAKAEDYKIPLPEGDKGEFAKVAANWFHEAGLTQAGAAKLATKWNEFQATQAQAQNDALAARDVKEVGELKAEWATDYDKHAAIVDKAAETFGMTPEQLAALKQVMGPKGAMNFMRNIGSKLGIEDPNFVKGDGPTGFTNMSPQQAQEEMTRLRKDKLFAQEFNSPDPRVKSEARAKMNRLAIIAAPGHTVVG
jgi:hypothetical protein